MSISYHVMLLRDGDRVQFPQPQTVPVSCLDVLCLEATWQNICRQIFSVKVEADVWSIVLAKLRMQIPIPALLWLQGTPAGVNS